MAWMRGGCAGQIQDGREDVHQVHHRAGSAGTDAGSTNDERHTHAVFVQVLLAHQAVTSQRDALVGREHDDGVLVNAGLFHAVDQAADVLVQSGDHGPVFGELTADFLGRARPGRKQFVANDHLTVVERMHGEEVPGQGDPGGIVEVQVAARGDPRIVRIAESEVHERGPVMRLTQEPDRFVDNLLAWFAAETFGLVVQVLVVFEAGLNEQGGVAALAVMVSLAAGRARRRYWHAGRR